MKKLTVQDLIDMKPGEIFAVGEAKDSPGDLYMANTGQLLKWCAVRSLGTNDWAIYCHFAEKGTAWIHRFGDKVQREEHIRKLVPCHDEAFALYRR